MVALKFPRSSTNGVSSSVLREVHRESPAARRFVEVDLPRANRLEQPKAKKSGGNFFARLVNAAREHNKAVSAVMLGASVLPMLPASTAMAADNFRATNDEGRFQELVTKSNELTAKKGTMPYSELTKLRADLWKEYSSYRNATGTKVDDDKDGVVLAKEVLFGSSDKKIDTDGDGLGDKYEIDNGLDPADAQAKGGTAIKTWTHGYIPMSNNPMIESGTLMQYDMLIKDRTGSDPATRHEEGKSALEGGHYFLSGTLDENNAEMTSGKDFNGDGVLTPGVKHDFLSKGSGEAEFGPDGKTDATLGVSWWGHCNNVATAGINFREPTRDVKFTLAHPYKYYDVSTAHGSFKAESVKKGATHTDIKLVSGQTVRLANADVIKSEENVVKEITFTPTQLKELAAELTARGSKFGTEFIGHRYNGRPAEITLKDGSVVRGQLMSSLEESASDVTGEAVVRATKFTKDITASVYDFSTGTVETKTYKADEIKSVSAENKRDVNPIDFHKTVVKWLGSEGKAGVMDKDSGPHVWNYAFDKYDYTFKQNASDPKTTDYEMQVYFVGNNYATTYSYSIAYDDAGTPVSAKWKDNSPNPDFFWREAGGVEGYNHAASGTEVEFKSVMELLNKSYAIEDAEAAAAGGAGASTTTPSN